MRRDFFDIVGVTHIWKGSVVSQTRKEKEFFLGLFGYLNKGQSFTQCFSVSLTTSVDKCGQNVKYFQFAVSLICPKTSVKRQEAVSRPTCRPFPGTHTAHWTLHTGHCTLHTEHWTLNTAHCTLHTEHCTLYNAHWTLRRTAIVQRKFWESFMRDEELLWVLF